MGDSEDMFRILISLLSLALPAQALEETDNRCGEGKECIHRDGCPSWSNKRAQLDSLEKSSKPYKDLLTDLLEEVCNRSEKSVCCSSSSEKQQLPSFQDSSKLPPIGECGKPRESVHHIVGGEETPLGEFPFHSPAWHRRCFSLQPEDHCQLVLDVRGHPHQRQIRPDGCTLRARCDQGKAGGAQGDEDPREGLPERWHQLPARSPGL